MHISRVNTVGYATKNVFTPIKRAAYQVSYKSVTERISVGV
jgi:hypothetical protein